MRERDTFGRKTIALPAYPQGRYWHRDQRRAASRCYSFRNALPGGVRQYSLGSDVGVFPLIRRHAQSGVAFHMLNISEILFYGLFDILNGDIILKINPLAPSAGDGPERSYVIRRALRFRPVSCGTTDTQRVKCVIGCINTTFQAIMR